jgi:hypothetical protein
VLRAAYSLESVQFAAPVADSKNTMWCRQCQQDVPAVASTGGKLCCTRCNTALQEPPPPTEDASKPAAEAAATGAPTATASDRPPRYDRWETEERLRHIGRVLHPHITRSGVRKPGRRRKRRIHQAHHEKAGWHHRAMKPAATPARNAPREPGLSLTVWLAISLGVMLLACGGILLGWSVLGHRGELWSLGLPIAVGGQVLLLFGLVLQLDRMWHHSRAAAAKLDDVDQQLNDLRSTTAMLGTTHSTPGLAFYSHMAGGASPQVLLADLKGQLDLLAMQMGKRDG